MTAANNKRLPLLQGAMYLLILISLIGVNPGKAIPVTRLIEEPPMLVSTTTILQSSPLTLFVQSVFDGNRQNLVGVYSPSEFAYPIIQQPNPDSVFVSSDPGVVTQFGMASEYGTVGLLAHNTLAGASFYQLTPSQTVYLIYGDGTISPYVIKEIHLFQALEPNNPYSLFVDQENPSRQLTSGELFHEMYGRGNDELVFQTCMQKDGEASWGRMFVIAEPDRFASSSYTTNLWQTYALQ